MTYAEYAKIDAVNWSVLRELRRSPLHYLHRLANPMKDTTRLGAGRALHTAVLEPDRFPLDYVVYEGARRAGKEWDAFAEANRTRTILKVGEYENVLAMRDAVLAHPVATSCLKGSRREQTITWTEKIDGVEIACKARPDAFGSVLSDLKSTGDAGSREFGRTAANFGYHCQLAWYRRGVHAVTGKYLDAKLIAVEFDAPHDVVVYGVGAEPLWSANQELDELLALLATCLASGRWPGVGAAECPLELPSWAMQREEEIDATPFDDVETSTGAGL